ncbi:MAG: hypothetical protein DCF17_17320 [Shackletoniella antarctica]|jgi:hypothetical protein|uniref:Uncharacterized protein n=1 Tax=Shackletoniella antarctica TaxID=268115 RepID=A0A2W4XYT7_9CYAN|nr:MAG: hypothetical protein DCF17_17320 [Shackletoniella antarctica]
MKYNLNFSLNLERHEHCVIYNEKEFTEKPIQISVPDIVELVEQFLKSFEEVAITEQLTSSPTPSKEKFKEESSAQGKPLIDSKSGIKPNSLRVVAAKAYICQSKDLDKKVLEQFCSDLTKYVQDGCSQISPENFLSEQVNLYVAGLREVLEIRNYLARYTKSKKKNYQNGYLYVVNL